MPSTSAKQHRYFEFIKHNPDERPASLSAQQVAEWTAADRGAPWREHHAAGGRQLGLTLTPYDAGPDQWGAGDLTPGWWQGAPQRLMDQYEKLMPQDPAAKAEVDSIGNTLTRSQPWPGDPRGVPHTEQPGKYYHPKLQESAQGGAVHLASGGMAGFGHLDIPHIAPSVHMGRGFKHASGAFNRPALAGGGSPMGISGGAADPWWTRAEARGEDVHPGGLIGGITAGRADHVPTNVMADSYVLPADIVSGLGEGSSLAGSAVIDRMLSSMPYGIAPPRFHGRGMPMPTPRAPAPPNYADGGLPGFAEGRVPHGQGIVPVRLSGGEYVVPPHAVMAIGGGDIERGHNVLDAFVKMQRAKHIKKLKALPGPKRND